MTLGAEGAGVVQAVGEGATRAAVGDRVAYAMIAGSYAEEVLVPETRLVRLPLSVDFAEGAAAMIQGLTAHYLTRDTFLLGPGRTALVHAAAGGVGLLLVQAARLLGARVIGTVSTEEKAELARQAGVNDVIIYSRQDFETEVGRLTEGRGVDVVYDSVGKDTFSKSLACLRPRGLIVLYGQSSGPVAPLDPQMLAARGSLFLTRPSLAHYISTPEELDQRAGEVFAWMERGAVKFRIGTSYPLSEAAQAHRDLEARKTTGKVLLFP